MQCHVYTGPRHIFSPMKGKLMHKTICDTNMCISYRHICKPLHFQINKQYDIENPEKYTEQKG